MLLLVSLGEEEKTCHTCGNMGKNKRKSANEAEKEGGPAAKQGRYVR